MIIKYFIDYIVRCSVMILTSFILFFLIIPFASAFDETWLGNAKLYNATVNPQYIEYIDPFDDSLADTDKTDSQLVAQEYLTSCQQGTKSSFQFSKNSFTTGKRKLESNGKMYYVLYPGEQAELKTKIVCSTEKQPEKTLRFEYRVYDDFTDESTLHSRYYLDGQFKVSNVDNADDPTAEPEYNFQYDTFKLESKAALSRTVQDNLESEQWYIIPSSSMIMTVQNQTNTDYYLEMKYPDEAELAASDASIGPIGQLNPILGDLVDLLTTINPVVSNAFEITSFDDNAFMLGEWGQCMAKINIIKPNKDNLELLASLSAYFYKVEANTGVSSFLLQYTCNPNVEVSEAKTKPTFKLLYFARSEYSPDGGLYVTFIPDFELYTELIAKCEQYNGNDCQSVFLNYTTGVDQVGVSDNQSQMDKSDQDIFIIN